MTKPDATPEAGESRWQLSTEALRAYAMVIALIVIWIYFQVRTRSELYPYGLFLHPVNFANLLKQMSVTGVLAVGMLFVIVARQIDLSVGSLVGLAGGIAAMTQGWGLAPSLLSALVIGMAIGALQGTLAAYLNIPAFIVTLGGLLTWRGVILYLSKGETIPVRLPVFRMLGVALITPASGLVLAAVALAFTGWRGFGFSPFLTGAALLLSVVLSALCARAAGETDIAPVGSFGTMTQFAFAASGPTGSLLAGAVVSGTASEVAQTMWAFKAGHNLKASVRAQIVAQVLGALVGSVVVVPVYMMITRVYALGTERMPAVSAISWKATADALTGGLSGLPPHGVHALLISFAAGTALCILARTRVGRFLPSAVALGIAMITPFSLSAAALVGAGGLALIHRRFPKAIDGHVSALAAGLLAGESILGVVIAALTSAALLK